MVAKEFRKVEGFLGVGIEGCCQPLLHCHCQTFALVDLRLTSSVNFYTLLVLLLQPSSATLAHFNSHPSSKFIRLSLILVGIVRCRRGTWSWPHLLSFNSHLTCRTLAETHTEAHTPASLSLANAFPSISVLAPWSLPSRLTPLHLLHPFSKTRTQLTTGT
jgi:hypothetical protein